MRSLFERATLLLGAVFVLDLAGPLPDEFTIFTGVLVLYVYYFTSIRAKASTWKSPATLVGFVITIGATALFVEIPMVRPFAFAIFLSGCALSAGDDVREKIYRESLVLAATIYAVLYYLLFASSLAWYATNILARIMSGLWGDITAHPLSLGATFTGMKTVLLIVIFVFTTRITSGLTTLRNFIFPIVCIVIAWILFLSYIVFLPDIFDFTGKYIIRNLSISTTPDGAHVLTFLLLASPLILFAILIPCLLFMSPGTARSASTRTKSPVSGLFKRYALPAAIIIVSITGFQILSNHHVQKRSDYGEILLYEKGFLNWLTPQHGEYGEYSAGMFGNLPKHLRALGVESRLISNIREDELQSASGLVLMNIDHEIPHEQLEAVWKFVRDGGTLLVLGDHTFWKSRGVNYLNICLEPSAIRYNFDSAEYMIGGWLNSYCFLHHPLTFGLKDDINQIGIVVGASLSIRPPASPLIVGTFGFSDAGDEYGDSTGYLGNLQFDRGEPLGDLVLAASQKYGNGRILVFGDTSAFTNPIAIWSFPFISRVFAWLISDSKEGVSAAWELFAIACLLVSLILIVMINRRMLGIYLVIPGVLLALFQSYRQAGLLDITPKGPIAYVDISHKERIPLEGWREGGVMGLQMNLQRDGYLTYVLNEFNQEYIRESKLLVIVAPTQSFAREERLFLGQWLADGGHLLLCIGYEERTASLSLLSDLGLRIDATPLGGFDCAVSDTLTARFIESWPVYAHSDEGEYLAYYEEYPLIVYKRIGKGGVLLIGDSDFFMNENLEHDNHPHMESIKFLRYLIKNYLKKGYTG